MMHGKGKTSPTSNNGYLSFVVITVALALCSLYLSSAVESIVSLQAERDLLLHKNRFLAPVLAAPDTISQSNPEPIPRPPLKSIVQGWNISGDASWLLQFSIVGFPKCGTSTLMHHLRDHPQVHIFADERCDVGANQQARLIDDLYELPSSNDTHQFIRGIKCPADVENSQLALPNYKKVFPKTNMIVGVRHPVLWFESFYNFRVHNKFHMPEPNKLIGRCVKGSWNVCTFRSNFHLFLNNLGIVKNHSSIVDYADKKFTRKLSPVVNPQRRVFFYEVSQLSDPEVEPQFRLDLQDFLELSTPIEPLIWFKPGKNHSGADLELINTKKIDICEYHEVRKVLMSQAVQASAWIRKEFLDAAVVSSRPYIEKVLADWENDPCEKRSKATTSL